MSEKDNDEKPICANCKYKMHGWKCMKSYESDYVTGIKKFGTCEHHRVFDVCRDFESKGAGRTKTEDQLTISDNISCTVATVSIALVVLGSFALLVVLMMLGG